MLYYATRLSYREFEIQIVNCESLIITSIES